MKTSNFTIPRLTTALVLLFGGLAGSPVRGALSAPEAQTAFTGGNEGVSLLSASASGLSFRVEIPLEALARSTVEAQGQVFEALEVEGWEQLNEPGLPALPYQTVTFGVPFGADVSLEVTPGPSSSLMLSAPLMPGVTQLPAENSFTAASGQDLTAAQTELTMDPAAYSRSSAYPGELARLSNEGVMRGQRVVSAAVFPLQYSPALNSLRVYESVTVKVTFKGGQVSSRQSRAADSAVFEEQFQNLLLNYPEARAWRQGAAGSAALAADSPVWDVPAPAWKVTLTAPGFYLLSRNALSAAGFPVDTPTPANIQLFNQGQEVAIEVRLNMQNTVESIIFYGQALQSKYTNKNVYWLTVSASPGLRMTARPAAPGTAALLTSHARLERFDSVPGLTQYYLAGATGADDLERYFMGFIYPTWPDASRRSVTLPFTLDHAPTDGSGILRASLYSMLSVYINPDHHVAFYVNDVYVGDTWFDGRTWHTASLSIPAGLLRSGANTLKVTCPNDTGYGTDNVFVDWLELEFPDPFIASGEKLTFRTSAAGTWRYQVSGFTASSAVDIFDISNPLQPARLTGANFASGTLSFEDTAAEPKTYQALGTGQYLAPVSILQDVPSDIKSSSNAADLVIISPSAFLSALAPLAAHRASQGTRTVVVDAQEVYDAFGYGIVSPYAIRSFLAYTLANWTAPAPAYVLLVGDGHRDPKNYEGFGRENFMTPFLVWADANLGESSSDNRYVSFDGAGDLLADMYIGRLPANSAADVTAMVNKILAYEALEPNSADWQKQVLFVADDLTYFANFADFMADYYVAPAGFTPVKVYQGVAPYETLALARAGIQTGINAGKLFVNYVGHGSYNQWADGGSRPQNGLLNNKDIDLLTNNGKPPIVLAMTCWEGYYINPNPLSADPTFEALAEIFTRKPLSGALASWSASGTAVATGHFSLNAGFYEAYFYDGVGTLGEAAQAGKLALWAAGYALDLLETYHLFGDPSILFERGFTAVSDDYEVNESAVLSVPAPGVLANDINPDGLPLTALYVEASGPAHGDLVFNQDGSFTYTPLPGWNGLDRFYYKAVSGAIETAPTFVNLFVLSTNINPAAAADTFTGYEDTQLVVPAPGVLANDTDGNDDPLMAELYQTTTRGYLDLQADGSFTYLPYSNLNGDNADSFTYRAYDGEGYSAVTTVTINLTPVNDAPIGFPEAYITFLNTPLNRPAPGVLYNDFDPDGDPFTAEHIPESGPLNGSLTLSQDGSFTYTPAEGFTGEDSFSYTASDGADDSLPVLVSITVRPPNNLPVAIDDIWSLDEDAALTVDAPGVLSNDTDGDDDPLTAVLETGPSHGLLTLYSDGTFIYTPDANFNGQDAFTYKAYDGFAYSNLAAVTLTINPLNDAPAAAADSYSAIQDQQLAPPAAAGVLSNDTDADGDTLTAEWVSGPSHGTLVLNQDGSFTYDPAPGYYGSDAFSYKASDGTAFSEPVVVSIAIREFLFIDLYLPVVLR